MNFPSSKEIRNNRGVTLVEGMIAFALLAGIFMAQLAYMDSVGRAHDITMRRWQVQLMAESIASTITSMSDQTLLNFLNGASSGAPQTETPYTFVTTNPPVGANPVPPWTNSCTSSSCRTDWLNNWLATQPSIVKGIKLSICLINQSDMKSANQTNFLDPGGNVICPGTGTTAVAIPSVSIPTLLLNIVRVVQVDIYYERFFGAGSPPNSFAPTLFSWKAVPPPSSLRWH
jgi:Tfp pilus assembly protein PilV